MKKCRRAASIIRQRREAGKDRKMKKQSVRICTGGGGVTYTAQWGIERCSANGLVKLKLGMHLGGLL